MKLSRTPPLFLFAALVWGLAAFSACAPVGPKRAAVGEACEKPKDCFTSVYYKGHWFWIDDRDFESKRTMIFLSMILALADTSSKENVPIVTIPAR